MFSAFDSNVAVAIIVAVAVATVAVALQTARLKVSVQVGAKMCAREAKLGPSWQQGATKMGHDSAKLVILGSTWEILGACWEHFRDYFGTWAG